MHTLTLILLSLIVGCGSKPTSEKTAPIEQPADKPSEVTDRVPSSQPTISSSTYPYQKYLQDDKALPYVQKEPACMEAVKRNTCPTNTRVSYDVAVGTDDKLVDCMIRCIKKDGSYHGPFERLVLTGYAAGEYERGAYEDNLTVGKWVRGSKKCDDQNKCTDRLLSESFYLKKYGIDGVQRDWNLEGQLIRSQEFQKGVPHGKFEEWWDDGSPRTKSTYKNGLLDGEYKYWHSNGQVNVSARYQQGGIEGPWVEFDDRGNRIVEGEYKNGLRVGRWKRWFANNQPQSEENYDPLGKPNGSFCYWKSNGDLIRCFDIKDGSGTFFQYDTFGVLIRKYTLRGGAMHGVETNYSYDGRVIGETHYDNDQLHGQATNWDEGGRLTSVYNYRRGQLHGSYLQQYWGSDMVVSMSRGQYCADRQCGSWRHETEDGRIREEQFSSSGTLLWERSLGPSGEVEFEWPSPNATDPYEKCLYAIRNGGCCHAYQNPPPDAPICTRNRRD